MCAGDIRVLRDDEQDTLKQPTRSMILQGFKWLMRDLRRGDSLFFYFSGGARRPIYAWRIEGTAVYLCRCEKCALLVAAGHGSSSQAICPYDYATAGDISGAEINKHLVQPLTAVRARMGGRGWGTKPAPATEWLPVSPACEQGTTLHALIDACYSGGVLHLPYSARLTDGVHKGWTKVQNGDWVSD